MASEKINWSDINNVLTPSFIMSVSDADRFTAERVGQSYHITGVEIVTPDNKGTSFELVHVSRGVNNQRWGLKTFCRNIMVKTPAGNVSMIEYLQSNTFTGFKVVGFEVSTNEYGIPAYSKGLVDPIKRAELFPEEMSKISKGEATMWTYAGVFNANITRLAFDAYLLNGQLTPEAIKKFQLGKLIVEVF